MASVRPVSVPERRYAYFVTSPEMRWIWKALGHELLDRHGLTPLLLVRTPEDRSYYERQFGEPVRGEIVVEPDIYGSVLEEPVTDAEFEEARDKASRFERQNGITLLKDMILADRQLSRPYLLGVKEMAQSRVSRKATHERAIRACVKSIEFFDDLLEAYPPALVVSVSGGAGLKGKPVSLYCKAHGIPFRNLTHSRFGHRYYWADDEFGNDAALLRQVERFPGPGAEAVGVAAETMTPTGDAQHYMKRVRDQLRMDRTLYKAARYFAAHLYHRLRGYSKAKTSYFVADVIREIFQVRSQWKYLATPDRPRLSELPKRKLVFFPLQVEPEASLSSLAPPHSDQLMLIRNISMNLPSDALLIVKEHPVQLRARGRAFYDSVSALPNTVLINIQEQSHDIIRASDLVVTVTGSAGHEAAVLGKKVVYLCPHGVIHALPHVWRFEAPDDFCQIPSLLAMDSDEQREKRRVDGARYFYALRENCLDLEKMDQFDRNKVPTPEEMAYIADSLVATLNDDWGTGAQRTRLRAGE